jgi:hypothetical protein
VPGGLQLGVEQIPLIAYIHPIWQAMTFAFGLFLIGNAKPGTVNPAFKARPHTRLGRIYLTLLLSGAVFGKLVSATMPAGAFPITGHTFVSVVIVALATIGAIFGYQGGRLRLRLRTGMMQWHPWLLVMATALILGQGLLGIGAKGLRLLKL